MPKLNEICKLAKSYILGSEPLRQIYQEANPFFPLDLSVVQDGPQRYYLDCCDRTMFHHVLPDQDGYQNYLTWQLQQLYRIINAAIASIDNSLNHRKEALIQFRKELEKIPALIAWLNEVDQGVVKTNLLCSGHGHCDIEDGYIKNFHHSEVLLYAPLGTTLDNSLAGVIEAEKFNPQRVYIKDLKHNNSFIPETYSFPKQYDQVSMEKLPNFTLSSDKNLKARIIESKTGRVLLEIEDKMHLQDLLQKFPGRKLIWVACTVVCTRNSTLTLGPNGMHSVLLAPAGLKKSLPQETSLRRLRRSTVKMKYDARFSLYASDRRGTLNEEVVAECKRKKLTLDKSEQPALR